jgi:hypothetical protein
MSQNRSVSREPVRPVFGSAEPDWTVLHRIELGDEALHLRIIPIYFSSALCNALSMILITTDVT